MVLEYKKRPRRRFRKREPLEKEVNRAIRNLIITLALMIIGLTVAFIATLNDSAQSGYTLQQEKQRNEDLMTENSNITTKITQQAAFSDIEQSPDIQDMEETEQKTYLTPEDNDL